MDEPFDAQPAANRAMAAVLRRATTAALVLSVLATFLGGPVGRVLAWLTFGVVVAVPLGRVAWLGLRWTQRGDRVFAGLALALLLIVATGGAIALRLG